MKRSLTLAVAAGVLLAGCSSGSSGGAEDTGTVAASGSEDAQTAEIGMTDKLVFAPGTVTAKVGTVTLSVKNEGNTPHNLTFADKGLGKTGTISGKETKAVTVTFDKAGTFTFTCTFHDGMDGKVVIS